MSWIYVFLLGVLGRCHVTGQPSYTYSTRTSLYNHLLTGYDKQARPAASFAIGMAMTLTHINELDTKNQILDVAGGFGMSWTDPRLAWDTSVYNLPYLHVLISDIWLPPATVYNAAEGRQLFTDDAGSETATIFPTGTTVWPHSLHFRTQCDVNIKYYPFDTQSCSIRIVLWNYLYTDIQLAPAETFIATEAYQENGEFDLLATSATSGTMDISGGTYAYIDFTLHLLRRQSYYILNILLPVVFLAFLGPVVFVLPVESGEKAGFSLTILLSMSVVMTIVSDQIPTTSTNVALISVYLLMTYIVCVIEVVVTILTLQIQNLHVLGYTPSPAFERSMRRYLKPLVRYRRSDEPEDAEKLRKNKVDTSKAQPELAEDADELKTDVIDWDQKDNPQVHQNETPYTYKDFCIMFDQFNLYFYEIITLLITIILFMTISIGGRA